VDEMQVVAFRLDNEEYAVDILAVQEIIRPTAITRVPKAPAFVKGVINLRGNVVPVINLRKRFGINKEDLTDNNARIIILNIDEIKIGITVDSVTEVIRIGSEDIEEPNLIESIDKKFVEGVGKYDDRLLILLNLEEILELARISKNKSESNKE